MKFTCDNYDINIDNGLYFGNKNSYEINQNIFITGVSNNQIEIFVVTGKDIMKKIKTALFQYQIKT